MEFQQAIQSRHSVRKFTDQPVTPATVKAILTDAQQAPSWVNSQPYHVHVAMGKSLERVRQQQADLEQAGMTGTPDVPLMSRKQWSPQAQANMAAWSQNLGAAGNEMAANAAQLYHAPVVLYLTLPAGYSDWSLYDLGAFGNSIVLSASSRGLASMTAYQFIKYPKMLRQQLVIPDDEKIIIGIGLGYRDDAALVNTIKATRMPLTDILSVHD
ncbi:nitroreductase [Lactiplantibacillus plajomi]|uniref:Nitroreductase n=1 Tax=Lactiplantibacillus plajomi TaxID=1457217 RepID=A0ABV6K179_9LACO|nr:nitroreductase [Lactiplantibacillus plajomi]